MSPLRKYSTRIAERWVVVAVLAAAGGLLAAVWSITTATTTWTATAALTSQSQERSPEQDGVLALGYVDYFNQASYQQLLRAQAGIPDEVELSAQTGASSPIIYIRASGQSEAEVRDAAANASEVFREDVRESLVRERRQAADDLQAEIDNNVQELNSLTRTDVEKNVIIDQIRSLQGRLTEFLADNTNQLKQLQPEPGVSSSTPSPVVDVVSGVVGGAIVGILIALVLALFRRRMATADDVRDATGLPVLAEVGRGDGSGTRTRLRNLLNGIAAAEGGGTTPVIAVVSVRSSRGASAFAHELVTAWSSRRGGALHVLADLRTHRPEFNGSPGLVDVLQGRVDVSAAAFTRADGQRVLPPGHVGGVDPYTLAETHALTEVLATASASAGLVVLEAPPILEAPESQSICAAAGQVVLVIDGGRTRLEDVEKAVGLLAAVDADVVGIVVHHADGLAERAPVVTVGSAMANRARTSPFIDPLPVGNGHHDPRGAERPSPHRRAGVGAASANGQIDADPGDGTWQG